MNSLIPSRGFLQSIKTSPGIHPASYSVGTTNTSLRIKWLGHEAYNSPTSSAEVNDKYRCIFTPPHVFMGMQRDNFTSTIRHNEET
jgi:hypothetical protein